MRILTPIHAHNRQKQSKVENCKEPEKHHKRQLSYFVIVTNVPYKHLNNHVFNLDLKLPISSSSLISSSKLFHRTDPDTQKARSPYLFGML